MLPAERIEAFVRGMNPWPGAYTFLKDKRLKLFKTGVVKADSHKPPGTVIRGFPDELRIATGENLLSILELQGESGKRLSIKEFLRGCEIPEGSAWVRFNIRFYVIALIFIIFDVEFVFLFPCAVVFKRLGAFAFIEGLIFIGILIVGLAYVWKKDDLEWVRASDLDALKE